MSFSAHRPGSYGSDGRIEFAAHDDSEPQYLGDVRETPGRYDEQTGRSEPVADGEEPEPEALPVEGQPAPDEAEPLPERGEPAPITRRIGKHLIGVEA